MLRHLHPEYCKHGHKRAELLAFRTIEEAGSLNEDLAMSRDFPLSLLDIGDAFERPIFVTSRTSLHGLFTGYGHYSESPPPLQLEPKEEVAEIESITGTDYVQVCVRTLTGLSLMLNVQPQDTVAEVKRRVCEREHIPYDCLCMMLGSKPLEDDKQLEDYGIGRHFFLRTTSRLRGGGCVSACIA